MNLSSLKKAVREIEECAGDAAADRLILVVPLKKNKAEHRKHALEQIARDRGEKLAEVRKMLTGYVPAVYVKATGLTGGYYMTEGDLCMLRVEGRYADSEHSGQIVYFDPKDLRLSDAYVVDENMEHSKDLDAAVAHLCETGGRPSRRW